MGLLRFQHVAFGDYRLQVELIGYNDVSSVVIRVNKVDTIFANRSH